MRSSIILAKTPYVAIIPIHSHNGNFKQDRHTSAVRFVWRRFTLLNIQKLGSTASNLWIILLGKYIDSYRVDSCSYVLDENDNDNI